MNNADVRGIVATVVGDTMSSFQHKISSFLMYRFESKSSEETVSLLAAIEAHRNLYPDEICYFQIYGNDGYENTATIIKLGTRLIPTASPLFVPKEGMSVENI